MKYLICVVLVGVALLAWWQWQTQHRGTQPPDVSATSQFSPAQRFPQAQEDVGWVFGRLVGIPGAEKPLSGGNALSYQGLALPPPATARTSQ